MVSLAVTGTLDLATRERFDRTMSSWRARFAWLEEDFRGLLSQPTEGDLDQIDTSGFVRAAINRLRVIHDNRGDPNQAYAAPALQLLYQIHVTGTDKE